jgi:hypothetical protein
MPMRETGGRSTAPASALPNQQAVRLNERRLVSISILRTPRTVTRIATSLVQVGRECGASPEGRQMRGLEWSMPLASITVVIFGLIFALV